MKPPYRVPSMTEVGRVPGNGLTMVSTFSGCGGSCLGFRMAGYRVLWANDSDPHAQETYRVNHPDTTLDRRDIRTIEAADILQATGLEVGELDVFEGSPPCTVFSTAGARAKKWGGVARHAGASDVKVEDLFFDWVRVLDGLRPRAFVAENVAGMLRGHGWRDVPAFRPLPTVTATNQQLRVRGRGWIRPLTMGQLKRFCGFPEDFLLSGPEAKQHARLGNAVPPLMARHIADALGDALQQRAEEAA